MLVYQISNIKLVYHDVSTPFGHLFELVLEVAFLQLMSSLRNVGPILLNPGLSDKQKLTVQMFQTDHLGVQTSCANIDICK